MVMKQALRGMQDILLFQAMVTVKVFQKVFKVRRGRLVRANVLRRIYRIELNTQLAVRGGKPILADIGQDHQLVAGL